MNKKTGIPLLRYPCSFWLELGLGGTLTRYAGAPSEEGAFMGGLRRQLSLKREPYGLGVALPAGLTQAGRLSLVAGAANTEGSFTK